MSQAIQGDSSIAPVALPLKRRRGRPRKDPSLKRVGRAPVPPPFEQEPEIQRQQGVVNGGMIGQAVTGVVEAAFPAGYLVCVRIGDSNTHYKGLVFKPGHFDPVTAENDVAPHLQMIRRVEVRPPAENQLQMYGHRGLETNGSPSLVSRSPKRKQASLSLHPSVPPVGARGTVVPVVLQPVNLTNELVSNQDPRGSSQVTRVDSVREREVPMVAPLAMLPPDGSVTTGQAGTGQKEDSSFSKGETVVQRKQVKPTVSTSVNKPVQVSKGSQGSVVSPITDTGNYEVSHALSVEHPPGIPQQRDMNQLPLAKPSEPVNPPLHTQAASVSKPLMNYGTGRMTELLQAVQENLMENQLLHAGESSLAGTKSPKMESSKETSVQ